MSKLRKLANHELNRIDASEFKSSKKRPIQLVLDNVRSAHNVGACFRTADAFRLSEIHLCGITAKPPHKEIRKTALGASDSVAWVAHENTLKAAKNLKDKGFILIAVEQTEGSINLSEFKVPEKLNNAKQIALFFGHEVKGVDQAVIDICDFCIEIPQWGTKHSLNISVSVGVVLWEIIKQLPLD